MKLRSFLIVWWITNEDDTGKKEIILKGIELGVDYSLTISCYQVSSEGLACGKCDSCRLRKAGFENAGLSDPTKYL